MQDERNSRRVEQAKGAWGGERTRGRRCLGNIGREGSGMDAYTPARGSLLMTRRIRLPSVHAPATPSQCFHSGETDQASRCNRARLWAEDVVVVDANGHRCLDRDHHDCVHEPQ